MRIHRSPTVEAIGGRIRVAALARGYTSERSASKVDIAKISKSIGVSYEMARRYVEGNARIPDEKMQLIAELLQVSLSWLSHGQGTMEPEQINTQILEECLKLVFEAEEKSGAKINDASKSKLAAELYKQRITGSQNSADILAAALGLGKS